MKFTLVLLIAINITSFAQETKKKTVSNEQPPYKETFYVLKSNPEVKEGPYTKTYRSWKVKGQFHDNKKFGIWEYYGRKGELEQKINFSTNEVIIDKPNGFVEIAGVIVNDSVQGRKPDVPPILAGGESTILYYVLTCLLYPPNARRMGHQGKVIVSATITKDGHMIDEKVEEGPVQDINEEALRVIQLIPDEWIPGKVNGVPADIRILTTITFKLG